MDLHIYTEFELRFILLTTVYKTESYKTSQNDRWFEKKMLQITYNLEEEYLVFKCYVIS
jgi:hypothetical protein